MCMYQLRHCKNWKSQRKGRAENNVKVGKIIFWCDLRLWNLHISETWEVVTLNSQENAKRFYLLNETIHIIISGDLLVLY